ncbi:hypothetical protein [Fusobacterium varium]|uniref:hypothetical protein n=1 Tax=Fusobacterium varium TaxID=856 RepID=UPI000E3F940A|nr:hypothetical protein [Fusobacterium varium]RGJ31236.1 hypothetical protein DXD66_02615 [Fusobacterium varium]
MKGIETLFKNNDLDDIHIKINKDEYIINNNRTVPTKEKRKRKYLFFDGYTFLAIIKKMKKIISLEETIEKQQTKTIIFSLERTLFKDKAAYILLETLIYLMCRDYNFNIKITFEKLEIFSIYQSKIKNILEKYKNQIIDKEKYLKDFSDFFITDKRFRKIIRYEKFITDKTQISKVASDLNTFFKTLSLKEEQKDLFIETLVELVGNACEHGKSDCLIDINIMPHLRRNCLEDEKAGFDIVIYNFSENLLGTAIKKLLESEEIFPFKALLEKAFSNHSKLFNRYYTLEDFYTIAAFQWRVSSREKNKGNTGGTGLTTLIKALIEFSVKDQCYVYSGKNILTFNKKYLTLSSEDKKDETYNLVGFNEEADFINFPPHKSSILFSPFYLNGTLYNFTFIMEKTN